MLDLLYPERCAGCGGVGEGVWCAACNELVRRLYPPLQTKQLVLETPWEGRVLSVTSAAIYETPLREAIHAFKYDGVPDLAAPFAQMVYDAWQQSIQQAEVIVAVPLHPMRKHERGYNQSELLAQHLGELAGVRTDMRLLRRIRYTSQQAQLGPAERKLNVQGAFLAVRERTSGRSIVIVDDVLTTGATLSECATALLNAGAQSVSAITLARAG
jgi:ComF family protein